MLRMTGRIGMLAVVALILIGAHGIIIYYFSLHLTLSTAVVSAMVILVLIQHPGWLGPLLVVFRRRSKRGRAKSTFVEPEPMPTNTSQPGGSRSRRRDDPPESERLT
jgi:hypothetical protein